LHYATRFVDGLKEDTKTVVMIKRDQPSILLMPLPLCRRKRWSMGRRRNFGTMNLSLADRFIGLPILYLLHPRWISPLSQPKQRIPKPQK
jgi:hypothetical protein